MAEHAITSSKDINAIIYFKPQNLALTWLFFYIFPIERAPLLKVCHVISDKGKFILTLHYCEFSAWNLALWLSCYLAKYTLSILKLVARNSTRIKT